MQIRPRRRRLNFPLYYESVPSCFCCILQKKGTCNHVQTMYCSIPICNYQIVDNFLALPRGFTAPVYFRVAHQTNYMSNTDIYILHCVAYCYIVDRFNSFLVINVIPLPEAETVVQLEMCGTGLKFISDQVTIILYLLLFTYKRLVEKVW